MHFEESLSLGGQIKTEKKADWVGARPRHPPGGELQLKKKLASSSLIFSLETTWFLVPSHTLSSAQSHILAKLTHTNMVRIWLEKFAISRLFGPLVESGGWHPLVGHPPRYLPIYLFYYYYFFIKARCQTDDLKLTTWILVPFSPPGGQFLTSCLFDVMPLTSCLFDVMPFWHHT